MEYIGYTIILNGILVYSDNNLNLITISTILNGLIVLLQKVQQVAIVSLGRGVGWLGSSRIWS